MHHATEMDQFNRLVQKNLIQKHDVTYHREGADHNPTHTCVLEISTTPDSSDQVILRSDPSTSKKLAHANVVRKFLNTYNCLTTSKSEIDYSIEAIVDLDNSADLLKILEHPSIRVNAFAAKQYAGVGPKHGTLTRAKSFAHDATDLLMAYKAKDIVEWTDKKNILLVSRDSAFDSLHREMMDDFRLKDVYFVSNKLELEALLHDISVTNAVVNPSQN